MEKCPKCSSAILMDHLRVIAESEGSGDIVVEAYGDPKAVVFRQAVRSRVEATVCGGCGYMELFALDPQILVDAVTEAERHRKGR